MPSEIEGLHHVTSMASDAAANNRFFTETLGLRRVKKTVNFDAPDVYHLYYGDAAGTPGTVMTYFPFPSIGPRRRGTGEVGETAFAVPPGAIGFWRARLNAAAATEVAEARRFGEARLTFLGPDGEELALVEVEDAREPWTAAGIPGEAAIRGFHGVTLRLAETGATAELLRALGYAETERDGGLTRFRRAGGNGAEVVDVEAAAGQERAEQGAGSVHHVAFAVRDRTAQAAVRQALLDAGHKVTPPIDRDYFWAIYFRTPGGVLFEVATDAPGFARDEDPAHLGEKLMLPAQHAHLRGWLESHLEPIP
jgi:glyoxalase family protein